jgi:hypothetical protein
MTSRSNAVRSRSARLTLVHTAHGRALNPGQRCNVVASSRPASALASPAAP